ncbi:uncharacterized protein LOC125235026 isoform X4 [Leguminivora glycinivorella]|uniref:uncharacterized protein LOC125235026 isoform X4 n=1 Tax=Leguminivora glycinivorella TaxID=1035111 RepID=UPI00200D91BE|nr:uncharacterized protein LOC125235026 isoform X4 [Leguminivora glycinivorella]
MGYKAQRIILLALFAVISQVDSGCELLNLGGQPCKGELTCTDDFGSAIAYVRDWSCRRHENYDDYYNGTEDMLPI